MSVKARVAPRMRGPAIRYDQRDEKGNYEGTYRTVDYHGIGVADSYPDRHHHATLARVARDVDAALDIAADHAGIDVPVSVRKGVARRKTDDLKSYESAAFDLLVAAVWAREARRTRHATVGAAKDAALALVEAQQMDARDAVAYARKLADRI